LSENGQTVIFSTHVMQHAERLCDHILLITRGKKIFDGTIAEAKAQIPRRVLLESSDDVSPISSMNGVKSLQEEPGSATPSWQIEIAESLNPQEILRACFEQGISLNRFEFTEPSLHDVFVHLVGSENVEQASS